MGRAILVQKFGGTSVGTAARLLHAARHTAEAWRDGDRVVAVVSAQAGVTDGLLAAARALHPGAAGRDLDLLLAAGEQAASALFALALAADGVPAVALTGPQAGIMTDRRHNDATVRDVRPGRVREEIARRRVAVVAGFQGQAENGEITTLGRGGSDLTAVVLAAALRARRCDIYTDVDGLFTADPRLVADARRHPVVSYSTLAEAASGGAKVMQARAAAYAAANIVPLRILSTFDSAGGTTIAQEDDMERPGVTAVVHRGNLARVRLDADVPDPTWVTRVLRGLAEREVPCRLVQYQRLPRRAHLSLVVPESDVGKVEALADGGAVTHEGGRATLSLIGAGLDDAPIGATRRALEALAELGIEAEMVETGAQRATWVITGDAVVAAVRKLHDVFGLAAAEAPPLERLLTA